MQVEVAVADEPDERVAGQRVGAVAQDVADDIRPAGDGRAPVTGGRFCQRRSLRW
ncbi:MAG: hypothetical protein RLZZ93_1375 [Actinomycetota bacterium]